MPIKVVSGFVHLVIVVVNKTRHSYNPFDDSKPKEDSVRFSVVSYSLSQSGQEGSEIPDNVTVVSLVVL